MKSILMIAALATLAVPAARADLFNFSYTGTGVNVSGQLTATLQSGTTYLITAITGTRNGVPITSLAPAQQSSVLWSDNLLIFPPGALTATNTSGFGYTVQGGNAYNPYLHTANCCGGTNGQYYEYQYAPSAGSVPGIPISFSVTAVPEPTPLGTLVVGLIAVLPLLRRPQIGTHPN